MKEFETSHLKLLNKQIITLELGSRFKSNGFKTLNATFVL